MEIDRSVLSSLLSQNDETLLETLRPVAQALGVNVEAPDTAARLRSVLAGLSPRDVEYALSLIGEKEAEAIFRSLGGGK